MLVNRVRFDRAYGRLQDEEGLSLIELMVALLIVGGVLSALASTIVASLHAITKNQREARAVALQTEMIERFQTVLWDETGIYRVDDETLPGDAPGDDVEDQSGFEDVDGDGSNDVGQHPWDLDGDGFDDVLGEPVVDLGTRPSTSVARFLPNAVEQRGEGDLDYTVESHVVFVSRDGVTSASGQDEETKQIVVIVRWTDVDGSPRETRIAAERSPPGKAVGYVSAEFDQDGDNVEDSVDNCPHTPNGDQVDGNGDGVGDACDRDGDGLRDADDSCPDDANVVDDPATTSVDEADQDGDGVNAACDPDDTDPTVPATATSGNPDINGVTIWKRLDDGTFQLTNRVCVSSNDATSAIHRVRVEVANMPQDTGTVEVTYWHWSGGNAATVPPDQATVVGSAVAGGSTSQTFYDAFIAKNTGKFRDEWSTGLQVLADPSDPSFTSDTFDNRYTVPIDEC